MENFKKAQCLENNALKPQLEDYDKQSIYNEAVQKMEQAKKYDSAKVYRNVKAIFESLGDFSDAVVQAETCEILALECQCNSARMTMSAADRVGDNKAFFYYRRKQDEKAKSTTIRFA